jgi:hypothetical protein
MKIINTLFLLFCLTACNDAKTDSTQTKQEHDTQIVSKETISNLDFIEFVLDAKAEKLFETWAKYIEIQNLTTNIKQGDLSFFKDNSELLAALIQDFKATVPEQINSPSILVRIKALETKMYKLESAVSLSTTNKQDLTASIKELLIAFSNFNLQINKKFEKESQNIQKP